jgi:hypothetical protein
MLIGEENRKAKFKFATLSNYKVRKSIRGMQIELYAF